MGLASQSHRVMSVMTAMNTTVSFEVVRLWMANSRKIPRQNSVAESSMEAPSVTNDGTYCTSETASR